MKKIIPQEREISRTGDHNSNDNNSEKYKTLISNN